MRRAQSRRARARNPVLRPRGVPAPITIGATKNATRSTIPASSAEPARCAPPSISTLHHPRRARLAHQGAQIDLTTAPRASDYLNARAVITPPRPRHVRSGRHQQSRRRRALDENARARRASQAPVDYDSHRIAAARHAAGQTQAVTPRKRVSVIAGLCWIRNATAYGIIRFRG